ncbi:lysozyme [Bradyrhizobium sp. CCGB20]|uniref:lysozyme n=1 Tax=Bradyrhizobium sp. CCGB20 TaxID=2949633 RepID=UPI0020B2F3B3|nr:lysozyme [Bradyrhizobium sp. CCGB20]MCP3400412.1 lysozyme [Bradyrhizobium sp. CCGB20]
MNDHLRTSKAGLNLIRSFEGLFLTAYYCPAGVLTIGYGHTNMDGVEPRVVKGMKITQEQAEDILRRAIVPYENAVKRLVKVPLTQSEFDALVSFAYNCGIYNLEKSTLLRKLNKGDYDCVPTELMKYVTAKTKKGRVTLAGLVRRRKAEGAMWALTKHLGMLKGATTGEPVEAGDESDEEPMAQDVAAPPTGSVEKTIATVTSAAPVLSFMAGIDWKIVAIVAASAVAGLALWLWYRHNNHA